MSGPASPLPLPPHPPPVLVEAGRIGPLQITVIADPTGSAARSTARVVPARRVPVPLAVVRTFRASDQDAGGNRIVGQADYESAMASVAELLAADLDRAVADLGGGRHALASSAEFEETFAEPAGAAIVGRRADLVDLSVRVTATVTAVELKDLERAALACLAESVPPGRRIAPGSMSARVTAAQASGQFVIYTVEASAFSVAAPDAEAGGLPASGTAGLPAIREPKPAAVPAALPLDAAAAAPAAPPAALAGPVGTTAAEASPQPRRLRLPRPGERAGLWLARAIGFLLALLLIGAMMISRPPG